MTNNTRQTAQYYLLLTKMDGWYKPVKCLENPARKLPLNWLNMGVNQGVGSRYKCYSNKLPCTPLCKCYATECANVIKEELWIGHIEDEDFPIGILGQVWYLIVSIPDLCTLTYFDYEWINNQNLSCFVLLTFRADRSYDVPWLPLQIYPTKKETHHYDFLIIFSFKHENVNCHEILVSGQILQKKYVWRRWVSVHSLFKNKPHQSAR